MIPRRLHLLLTLALYAGLCLGQDGTHIGDAYAEEDAEKDQTDYDVHEDVHESSDDTGFREEEYNENDLEEYSPQSQSRASRQDLYSEHLYEPAPSYSQPSYHPPSYHPPSYSPPQTYSPPSYHQPSYQPSPPGYQPTVYKPKKRKTKKVFVPVYVPDKAKKKMKIISVDKGFFIGGGQQLYGKFKSLKHCMKACAKTPSCFGGDYNPWLHKCYQHSNYTACNTMSSHPQYVHFSKVPCTVTDAPTGRVTLGVSMANGLESKGIDSLSQCIKKCATAGPGILPTINAAAQIANQACFAIDYDFCTHKCYFFGSNFIDGTMFALHCPVVPPPMSPIPPTSQGARPNSCVVHVQFCPKLVAR